MANLSRLERRIIEGPPALIVVDHQASTFIDDSEVRAIDDMPGYKERMLSGRVVVDKAREKDVPVIFVQEIYRLDHIGFGRELDGSEDVHNIEGDPNTEIAKEEMGFQPSDYVIPSAGIQHSLVRP